MYICLYLHPNFSLSIFFLQSPSPQPTFILQPTSLITQPPKTREPPRYEEAVKQSRNMHINNAPQVRQCPDEALKKFQRQNQFQF